MHETMVSILHRSGDSWNGYGSKVSETAAYTAEELSKLIPMDLPHKNSNKSKDGEDPCHFIRKRGWGYDLWYEDIYDQRIIYPGIHDDDPKKDFTFFNGPTLAQCFANALIWLIENDFVKPSELKL